MKDIIVTLVIAACVLMASCGIITSLLGSSGLAPGANTPEAKAAAAKIDLDAYDWIGKALFGVGGSLAGAAAAHGHHKRKAKKVAA